MPLPGSVNSACNQFLPSSSFASNQHGHIAIAGDCLDGAFDFLHRWTVADNLAGFNKVQLLFKLCDAPAQPTVFERMCEACLDFTNLETGFLEKVRGAESHRLDCHFDVGITSNHYEGDFRMLPV